MEKPLSLSPCLGLCIALLAGLAACSGSGGAGQGIASLGAAFQRAFNQDANADPIDVANAGLTVQLQQDPFAL